jgi:hypothetical protein
MRCQDINDLLESYIDGDLDPGRCGDVEAHLGGCPACRKALESARQIAFELRALPPEACPENVTDRVRERIGRRDARPRSGLTSRFLRRALPAGRPVLRTAAVLLALAVVLTYFIWRFPGGKPPAYSPEEISRARRGLVLAFGCMDHAMSRTGAVLRKEKVPEKILRPLRLDIVFKGPQERKGETS